MAEFVYNITKNASTGHTLFKLNCGYYPCIFFNNDTNFLFQLKTAIEQSSKLNKQMTVCQKKFYYTQEFQKQVHDKGVKSRSYVSSNTVWLKNKYI